MFICTSSSEDKKSDEQRVVCAWCCVDRGIYDRISALSSLFNIPLAMGQRAVQAPTVPRLRYWPIASSM